MRTILIPIGDVYDNNVMPRYPHDPLFNQAMDANYDRSRTYFRLNGLKNSDILRYKAFRVDDFYNFYGIDAAGKEAPFISTNTPGWYVLRHWIKELMGIPVFLPEDNRFDAFLAGISETWR